MTTHGKITLIMVTTAVIVSPTVQVEEIGTIRMDMAVTAHMVVKDAITTVTIVRIVPFLVAILDRIDLGMDTAGGIR